MPGRATACNGYSPRATSLLCSPVEESGRATPGRWTKWRPKYSRRWLSPGMARALRGASQTIALGSGGTYMNRFVISSLAGLALLGACRGNDSRPDDALKNDLALAAQAQPYQAQQFVSP